MTILITGAAGFVGFHLCQKLLARGEAVVGLDNLNDYYDVNLKLSRLTILKAHPNFSFVKADIADREVMIELFNQHQFKKVANLAAQAGVRYSLSNPHIYIEANVMGFCNILEGCRAQAVQHLVFASTSSVYGANTKQPFQEHDSTDHPLSLYAATKKANEVMAHSYASLFNIPCTGLRFFNVYGPWGRPDMALFKFTKNILAGEPIDVFNHGNMIRDFTYVDDIAEGVLRALDQPATPNVDWDGTQPDSATSYAPYRIYNIGNNKPVPLMEYIHAIEAALDKKALIRYLPMQAGDVPSTYADVSRLELALHYRPRVDVREGVKNFVNWYREYYKV